MCALWMVSLPRGVRVARTRPLVRVAGESLAMVMVGAVGSGGGGVDRAQSLSSVGMRECCVARMRSASGPQGSSQRVSAS